MPVNRKTNKAALLIVDMQVGVVRNAWDSTRVIQNAALLIDKARHNRVPVIWVQHTDEELIPGTPGWQIVPELVPNEGESIIHKHFNSSFEETSLEETLAQLGVGHIVLAGAATNWCIRATAYAALERGYDLTLIGDAHTTESIELASGAKIEAEAIIQELNYVISGLSYPGRTNRTLSTQDMDFSRV